MDLVSAGEVAALSAGALWAMAVILFRLAGASIDPLPLNLFKGVVALAIFVPLLLVTTGGSLPAWDATTWSRLLVSGVIGIAVADTLFFTALNRLGAGLNAMVSCLYFPLLAFMASVVLGDEIRAITVLGAGLVILGIVVGSTGSGGAHTRREIATGLGVGVVGVIALTTSVILIDGVVKTQPVLQTTTVRLVAGMSVLTPVVLLGAHRQAALRLMRPSPLWRYALPAAVLGGALAMLAWIAGFSLTDVSRAAILNQLSTIYIFLLAWLVLKEPLTARRALAVISAFAGAAIVIVAG